MRRMDLEDVLAVVGLGLLGAGLWMYWPPLALMVCGTLLMAFAALGAWRKG